MARGVGRDEVPPSPYPSSYIRLSYWCSTWIDLGERFERTGLDNEMTGSSTLALKEGSVELLYIRELQQVGVWIAAAGHATRGQPPISLNCNSAILFPILSLYGVKPIGRGLPVWRPASVTSR
jgi:hypothetical protein